VTAASTLMYAFATSLVAAPVTLLALSFNAL
jgi:hypothetical protein